MSHPSLRALRAFAEVGRTGSAAAAGRTMGVSPSAVSHLLRDVERTLGLALFKRCGSGLQLTDAGERLLRGIGNSFEVIDQAVIGVLRARGEVRISTLSTFASLWLVPRLGLFRAERPGTRLLLATETRPVDLTSEPFDCAIRWGRGPWLGLEASLLFRERLAVVANPRLASERGGLTNLPRLAARSRPEDWPLVAAAMGLEDAAPATIFETRALAVQASVAGLGAAVVDRCLIGGLLSEGLLVELGPETPVLRPEAHFFVATREALRDPHVRSLRDWLVAEAARS